MSRGSVYNWHPQPGAPLGGSLSLEVAPLLRLEAATVPVRLSGEYVVVHNAGEMYLRGEDGEVHPVPLGDAEPNADGDFLFNPHRGGGRIDKQCMGRPNRRERYRQAAHFGEVNAYYHLDRMAAYLHELLTELGHQPLPRVTALVNAHHGVTEYAPGLRDGVLKSGNWLPFQGGHYRLPTTRANMEYHTIAPDGEIHLGPGWQLITEGALPAVAGRPYRANAAHNPGILYHEYGHHLTSHTADFCANALRDPERPTNKKTALDEGTCDYWAAVMLENPHIWACHHRHDAEQIHSRSLASPVTMADVEPGPDADPHVIGTVWGAALWDVRRALVQHESDGAHRADLLVLHTLLRFGALLPTDGSLRLSDACALRSGFDTGLRLLLEADAELFDGAHHAQLLTAFARRGIVLKSEGE